MNIFNIILQEGQNFIPWVLGLLVRPKTEDIDYLHYLHSQFGRERDPAEDKMYSKDLLPLVQVVSDVLPGDFDELLVDIKTNYS